MRIIITPDPALLQMRIRVLYCESAVGNFEPHYFASARGLGPKARRMRLTWDAHLYMHKKRNKR